MYSCVELTQFLSNFIQIYRPNKQSISLRRLGHFVTTFSMMHPALPTSVWKFR